MTERTALRYIHYLYCRIGRRRLSCVDIARPSPRPKQASDHRPILPCGILLAVAICFRVWGVVIARYGPISGSRLVVDDEVLHAAGPTQTIICGRRLLSACCCAPSLLSTELYDNQQPSLPFTVKHACFERQCSWLRNWCGFGVARRFCDTQASCELPSFLTW